MNLTLSILWGYSTQILPGISPATPGAYVSKLIVFQLPEREATEGKISRGCLQSKWRHEQHTQFG